MNRFFSLLKIQSEWTSKGRRSLQADFNATSEWCRIKSARIHTYFMQPAGYSKWVPVRSDAFLKITDLTIRIFVWVFHRYLLIICSYWSHSDPLFHLFTTFLKSLKTKEWHSFSEEGRLWYQIPPTTITQLYIFSCDFFKRSLTLLFCSSPCQLERSSMWILKKKKNKTAWKRMALLSSIFRHTSAINIKKNSR